jgi:hypothetical protein
VRDEQIGFHLPWTGAASHHPAQHREIQPLSFTSMGSHELSHAPVTPDLTGDNWRCRKDKGQKTDMHKAGVSCAGLWDGDTQQPHYFFSLLFSSFILLLFSIILFFYFASFLLYSIKPCF